jgi:hypothetical protein
VFDTQQGQDIFSKTPTAALGPIQLPIQCVLVLFPWGQSDQGVKLTAYSV